MGVLIKYSDTVPKMTNVVAFWPTTTILPAETALQDAASGIGEPFEMIGGGPWPHQGVTTKEEMPAYVIGQVFAEAAGGNAPQLMAVPSDLAGIVQGEKGLDEIADAAKDTLEAAKDFAVFSANLPRYLLIGGLVLGGALVIGGGIYLYQKHRSKK